MKIRELMTSDVHTCTPQTTLQEIGQIMADLGVGIVPVVTQDGNVQGMITDRDIVVRAVAKGMEINSTHCADCMSESVVSCSPDQTADDAAKMMADNQVRRLPVVENGKLCGIVAIGDLAVQGIHENEAGYALSEISEPDRTNLH